MVCLDVKLARLLDLITHLLIKAKVSRGMNRRCLNTWKIPKNLFLGQKWYLLV
ncbi:hypothetical protein KSF78_0009367 [Schistosoma japonicum]|nr:hypothetical protein KSF78_0009367 [Schistosoma japonicum]